MFDIFFKGLLIGFIIATPIGPVGMLGIRKALEMGLPGALAVGLGAALADLLYALIAALGIAAIANLVINHTLFFNLFGGIFLLLLAFKEFQISRQKFPDIKIQKKDLWQIVPVTFFITLANPMTIMGFFAIFSAFSVKGFTAVEIFILVSGVFFGSISWMMIVGLAVKHSKKFLPEKFVFGIRKFTVVVLVCFGVFACLKGFGINLLELLKGVFLTAQGEYFHTLIRLPKWCVPIVLKGYDLW